MFLQRIDDISILDSVTEIGSEAFHHCEELDTVTIPEGVTSVADGTFSYCYSLHTVTLPDSVTAIEERAFTGTTLTKFIFLPMWHRWNRCIFRMFALSNHIRQRKLSGNRQCVVRKSANGDYTQFVILLEGKILPSKHPMLCKNWNSCF